MRSLMSLHLRGVGSCVTARRLFVGGGLGRRVSFVSLHLCGDGGNTTYFMIRLRETKLYNYKTQTNLP